MKKLRFLLVIAIWFCLCSDSAQTGAEARSRMCTYVTSVWNVREKRSVGTMTVRHPYSRMQHDELDPVTGCSVCSEDQTLISIASLPQFSVCSRIAPQVRESMERLVQKGAPLLSVTGYRVIRSRGPLDAEGNRTGLSKHSYGAAIDINPEQNGLYDNCVEFGPECRLVRGGEWRPGAPGTIEPDGDIVRVLKEAGFQWGGTIAGTQKDFMHFSLTGY